MIWSTVATVVALGASPVAIVTRRPHWLLGALGVQEQTYTAYAVQRLCTMGSSWEWYRDSAGQQPVRVDYRTERALERARDRCDVLRALTARFTAQRTRP